MSLSPGQAAILRALGEGREILYTRGVVSDKPMYFYRTSLTTVNARTARILEGREYLYRPEPQFGETSVLITLTDKGREALRALEQEAADA